MINALLLSFEYIINYSVCIARNERKQKAGFILQKKKNDLILRIKRKNN